MSPGKKVVGLILFSIGIGTFIVLILPNWGYILAALLIVVGFWILYC